MMVNRQMREMNDNGGMYGGNEGAVNGRKEGLIWLHNVENEGMGSWSMGVMNLYIEMMN